MRTITKVIVATGAIGLLVGCGTQPNLNQNVNTYVNSKIKNENTKQQKFKEDSLRCELYANNSVSQPNRTYNYVPDNSRSGDFSMRNTATGERYSGSYSSNSGGGFSRGLANGSAFGSSIADNMRVKDMTEKAWKYCMMSAGWREK